MAKPIVVSHQGVVSSFQLSKLERQKLYGAKRRIPVDGAGEPCSRAALTDDGAVLITAASSLAMLAFMGLAWTVDRKTQAWRH